MRQTKFHESGDFIEYLKWNNLKASLEIAADEVVLLYNSEAQVVT